MAVGKTSAHVGAALAIFRKGVSVPLGQYAPQDRILLPGIWIDRCAEERRRKVAAQSGAWGLPAPEPLILPGWRRIWAYEVGAAMP